MSKVLTGKDALDALIGQRILRFILPPKMIRCYEFKIVTADGDEVTIWADGGGYIHVEFRSNITGDRDGGLCSSRMGPQ